MQYYSFLLSTRANFNPILNAGKLFQQYAVDAYVKMEANRLNFIWHHQNQLRAEDYCVLHNRLENRAAARGVLAGRTVILPSSFEGSPRNMQQRYQDALAIVAKFGKPDLFITMTCNPKWKEITDNLLPGNKVKNWPDLVVHVFNIKLRSLLKDLRNGMLGTIIAMIYVIEFQKRGLPHAHILIILDNASKLRTEEEIDKIVWAEIPDQTQYPKLNELVLKHMIHGPCGEGISRYSPCMENGKCSKYFPKAFQDHTMKEVDGYPVYRRRHNNATTINGKAIDNSWVVPYNPVLLKKYNCHINVEVCALIKSIKYLFKYVYKGHDKANLEIQQQTAMNHDEPANYAD